MRRILVFCSTILGVALTLALIMSVTSSLPVARAEDADIYAAATHGDLNKVQKFLQADPTLLNAPDNDGRTPLLYACSWGHANVVKWLLEKGAEVNIRDKDNRIPLHWAAGMGFDDVVAVLLEHKSDLTAKDKDARTPLDMATAKNQDKVVAQLREAEKNQAGNPAEPPKPIYPTRVNPIDGAEMILVPAGEFIMGSDAPGTPDSEKPAHKVYLDAFWVYKNPVTVAQYRNFCKANGDKRMPGQTPAWGWVDNHPIVSVSWKDALDYALWAGGLLPTEAQWEKAARGTDGRTYPWGNDWDATKCNSKESNTNKTVAIGSFPTGASPYGVLDMAGNVDEWCLDWLDSNYYASTPPRNPTGPKDPPDPTKNGGLQPSRVRRGGNYTTDTKWMYSAHRNGIYPVSYNPKVGFRVVIPLAAK